MKIAFLFAIGFLSATAFANDKVRYVVGFQPVGSGAPNPSHPKGHSHKQEASDNDADRPYRVLCHKQTKNSAGTWTTEREKRDDNKGEKDVEYDVRNCETKIRDVASLWTPKDSSNQKYADRCWQQALVNLEDGRSVWIRGVVEDTSTTTGQGLPYREMSKCLSHTQYRMDGLSCKISGTVSVASPIPKLVPGPEQYADQVETDNDVNVGLGNAENCTVEGNTYPSGDAALSGTAGGPVDGEVKN